ncbi:hypothetical protein FO519_007319 [Halicephalobus sp. NKZ332]|nr:hypothetical protein FO519_007319 [Halicephalobus sp. NKZ332]
MTSFFSIIHQSPFDYEDAKKYTESVQNLIFVISIFYIFLIFGVQKWMKNRKAFELRIGLQLWNLWLAVFSLLGSFITGKTLFEIIGKNGIVDSYCNAASFWQGTSGFWTFLFCFSKVAELGDTVFIVLRKKPLIFLHWYHHVATLNYAVLTYIDSTAFNTWIIFLNFSVHAVMYSYYFLSACKIRVSPMIAQSITFLQIAQFLITHGILFHIGYLVLRGVPCKLTSMSYFYCLFMEISYVYLFGRFFYQSYIAKGKQNKFEKNQ